MFTETPPLGVCVGDGYYLEKRPYNGEESLAAYPRDLVCRGKFSVTSASSLRAKQNLSVPAGAHVKQLTDVMTT